MTRSKSRKNGDETKLEDTDEEGHALESWSDHQLEDGDRDLVSLTFIIFIKEMSKAFSSL